MAKRYNHKTIEKKWQDAWQKSGLYKTPEKPKGKKSYILDMFPYLSGAGLHVGHPKGYIATDIYSRYKKMNGYSILHPMGWDAFGLPAEEYALKNKIHPRITILENIKRFKEQLSLIGFNYDWGREINTTDPDYYKWTQWIFLKLYEKDIAYQSNEPINWCPSCKTGLANEDLEGNTCERCGSTVEKRPLRQWVLKITDYANRLLEDLDALTWPEHIKESQRNWIGRSEGAFISFPVKDFDGKIEVFTTRADTLFGATYVVLAPEHPFVTELKKKSSDEKEIDAYIKNAKQKTEIERTNAEREKTGVEIKGVCAVNPANQKEIPVFVADYVLPDYGTGAIMAVPAHDARDFQFAKKFKLPVVRVVKDGAGEDNDNLPFEGNGILAGSGEFDGMESSSGRKRIMERFGKIAVKYKLRDWVFSRQRYWGEPIPIIHCEKCGVVPVPEKDLPVRLPEVEKYEPTGTGESPLANISEWVNVPCPQCGTPAKRETNTMPQWAGSSWYYLRYLDPKNDTALVDKEKDRAWSPVDFYVGGAEHATRHLIYARFWHKFLYDIGVVNYKEPFMKLQNVGLVLAEDGRKMSKRWGNTINPDDIVNRFGADTLRLYEMFMGPFDHEIAWNTNDIIGTRKFLERFWDYAVRYSEKDFSLAGDRNLTKTLHKTIGKVSKDIEEMKFNTAISQMMILLNELRDILASKETLVPKKEMETFIKIMAPFAPHISEELWSLFGNAGSVHETSWPEAKQEYLTDIETILAVQVNGKLRDTITIPREADETDALARALKSEKVRKWTRGGKPKKDIYVKGRILNIIV